jgi:hypothetical protein
LVGLALLGILDLAWTLEKLSGGGGTLANGISPLLDSQPVITPAQATDISAAQSDRRIRFDLIEIPRARMAYHPRRRALNAQVYPAPPRTGCRPYLLWREARAVSAGEA